MIYGGDKESAWNTPLHADEDGKPRLKEKKTTQVHKTDVTVKLTQWSIHSNILTLEQNINDEIKGVNARKKADTAMTKAAIGEMEVRIVKNGGEMEMLIKKISKEMETRISKRMDNQVHAFKSLHEGQVHMEENLRLIMQQVCLHPTMRTTYNLLGSAVEMDNSANPNSVSGKETDAADV